MKKLLLAGLPAVQFACLSHANAGAAGADTEAVRSITFGTTIVTHGFQLSGDFPSWPVDMACAIVARAGAGEVLRYDAVDGLFKSLSNFGQSCPAGTPISMLGEKVLLFDWAVDSNIDFYGYSEAASDALFAALRNGAGAGQFPLADLHFIGHSRGAVINSEVVERLLHNGVDVDHVTYLDPHDWGLPPPLLVTFTDDWDVNSGLVISEPSATSPNSGVVGWSGAAFIDTYWQDCTSLGECGFNIIYLTGRSVEGTSSRYLGTIGHSNVWAWYLGTIDGSSGQSGWYGGAPRTDQGFHYSRVGGGDRAEKLISGSRLAPIFTFELEGMVNGDFNRGPTCAVNGRMDFPGWEYHGPGGFGCLQPDSGTPSMLTEGHLELGPGNTVETHNRFYVPADAEKLRFRFKVTDEAAGTPENTDYLVLRIDLGINATLYCDDAPAVPVQQIWLNQLSDWVSCEADLTSYASSVETVTFQVLDDGAAVDSLVWIDDVEMTIALPDFDGDGMPDATDPDDDNDGIPDTFEQAHPGLDPFDASDAVLDPDNDDLTNLAEFNKDPGLDPNDPDSDGDGIQDNLDDDPVFWSNLCSGVDANLESVVSDHRQCAAPGSVTVKGSSGVTSSGDLDIISPRTGFDAGFYIDPNGTIRTNSASPCPACP